MIILSKEEFEMNKETYFRLIKQGSLFIYPTDTIYGLGCSAADDNAVKKLRRIKRRPNNRPLSIIAPSKEWIYNNCAVKDSDEEWIKKLPGSYTLIFKLKKKNTLSKFLNPQNETIGIRIPKHWFSKFVNELNLPIVTTSVNISGEEYMTSLENLNENIKKWIDFVISDGLIPGKPSIIVDLTGKKERIINR